MQKTLKPNRMHSWSFVLVQAIILILLIFLNSDLGPSVTKFRLAGTAMEWSGWLLILISAYSIRTVLTAEPLPKENGKLSTGGLYKYVRHPMYSGVLLLSLGIAVTSGSVIKYALVGILALLFHFKTRYEEKYLRMQYPEYELYAKKTPKFIPFIK
jgi:protein-S-isoprenylcysteine O-methyltransferase Ste14